MNMQKMMAEMQKVQSKLARAQEELQHKTYDAEAGGGAVKITMNGKYEVQSVRLQKDAVDPNDIEALEDLLLAAFNEGRSKVDAASQEMMGGMTKGLKIPGM